jgi:hypothetical protein
LGIVVHLGQFGQQGFGLPQVGGVKPVDKPAINICQERAGLVPLALLLPQPAQAHGRPQLQRFRLLAAGEGEMSATFRLMCVRGLVASRMPRASQVILLRPLLVEGADVSEHLPDLFLGEVCTGGRRRRN